MANTTHNKIESFDIYKYQAIKFVNSLQYLCDLSSKVNAKHYKYHYIKHNEEFS